MLADHGEGLRVPEPLEASDRVRSVFVVVDPAAVGVIGC